MINKEIETQEENIYKISIVLRENLRSAYRQYFQKWVLSRGLKVYRCRGHTETNTHMLYFYITLAFYYLIKVLLFF